MTSVGLPTIQVNERAENKQFGKEKLENFLRLNQYTHPRGRSDLESLVGIKHHLPPHMKPMA